MKPITFLLTLSNFALTIAGAQNPPNITTSNQTLANSASNFETSQSPSTTKTTTTTTTTASTTVPQANHKKNNRDLNTVCACDLKNGTCDVGCCCDAKCSEDDRKAFKSCKTNAIPNLRYCFYEETTFLTKIQRVDQSLYCILEDNLKSHNEYLDKSSISNHSEFTRTISETKTNFKTYGGQMKRREKYHQGDPLWMRRNDDIDYLYLPTALNGYECNSFNAVKFMQSGKNVCQMVLPRHRNCSSIAILDLNFYVDGISVFNQPPDENQQENVDMSTFAKLPGSKNYERNVFPRPSQECNNVLVNLHYEVIHNGSGNGILKINAYADLENLGKKVQTIDMLFSYNQIWLHEVREGVNDMERSGNPGYIVGKPLIFGALAMDKNGVEYVDIKTHLWTELSSLVFPPSGNCEYLVRDRGYQILFGKNSFVGCSLRFRQKEDCDLLKRMSQKILLNDTLDWRVASFGNSDIKRPNDWTPILWPPRTIHKEEEDTLCDNIILSSQLEILHASVGSLANPQAKIIGARYSWGNPRKIRFKCLGSSCKLQRTQSQKLELSFRVSFIDVTTPALSRFAEFPKIEAKFPHDFFYPFISHGKDEDEDLAIPGSGSVPTYEQGTGISLVVWTIAVMYGPFLRL